MAVKYKMVNSDFDSTLTNSRGEITDATRAAIKRYMASGGIFLVNTGRSYKSLLTRLHDVYGEKCDYPVACLQGGMIYSADGKLIYNIVMDKTEMLRIVKEFEALGEYIQVYSGNRLFAAAPHEWAAIYEKAAGTRQEFVGKLSGFLSDYDGGIDKVLLISDTGTIAKQFKLYSDNKSFKDTKFVYSTEYFLEAIPMQAGKDVALKRFAEMYGVDMSETAAVGDSNNDIQMIKEAALGVAMGNAVDELKAAADYITADMDEDGLAQFLNSIVID